MRGRRSDQGWHGPTIADGAEHQGIGTQRFVARRAVELIDEPGHGRPADVDQLAQRLGPHFVVNANLVAAEHFDGSVDPRGRGGIGRALVGSLRWAQQWAGRKHGDDRERPQSHGMPLGARTRQSHLLGPPQQSAALSTTLAILVERERSCNEQFLTAIWPASAAAAAQPVIFLRIATTTSRGTKRASSSSSAMAAICLISELETCEY